LDYVARGEVDAGLVYGSDAVAAEDRVDIVATMSGHAPILYPAAVVSSSQAKDEAVAFVEYLTGPEAGAILSSYGFRTFSFCGFPSPHRGK